LGTDILGFYLRRKIEAGLKMLSSWDLGGCSEFWSCKNPEDVGNFGGRSIDSDSWRKDPCLEILNSQLSRLFLFFRMKEKNDSKKYKKVANVSVA